MYCRKKCMKMLDEMGFRPTRSGTEYIAQGVERVMADRRASMTKDIYPGIAAAVGRSPKAIERAMRSALEDAQNNPDWEWQWGRIGGWDNPTNREVLHRLARALDED